jgi:hypothetical protein
MRASALPTIIASALVGLPCATVIGWAQPPVHLPCVTIEVSAPQGTSPGSRGAFSAQIVEDLTMRVLFPEDLVATHLLALDFRTPRGFLYQTITVPVAAPGVPPAARAIEGYPRPVQEIAPRPTTIGTERFQEVDVPFPVGGTQIVTSSLYGAWQVSARLDGAFQPCAPATVFTIGP